jgi:hypothetical protein
MEQRQLHEAQARVQNFEKTLINDLTTYTPEAAGQY